MARLFRYLAVFSVFLIYGCGGGGGGSSPDPVSSQEVTLTTALELAPSAQAAGVMAQSVHTAAVTGAVVTLTLPDDTTYTMTDNGNGGYSCTVSDFPTGSPFVIEAHAGDLVLKNFFDRLPETEDVVDLGVTDPDTTLFTDLIAAFAGALDANHNTPTAADLLNAVQGASLQIDLVTLRDQVEDENDPTFEQVRSTYRAVLREANVNGGRSSTELIAEAGTFEEVVTEIESGGMMPPAAGSDSDAAKLFLASLWQAMLEGDLETLAAGLGSEGFLWGGMDREAWLLDTQTEEEFGGLAQISFTRVAEMSTVEVGPVADSWWVYLGGEGRYTLDGVDRYFKFQDKKDFEEISPILVKKDAAGRFAAYGDQKKSWVGADLDSTYVMNSRVCYNYTDQEPYCEVGGNSHTRIALGADVLESSQHPVQSVTLTSSAFAESFPVVNEPWDDSNERSFWLEYQENGTLPETIGIYQPEQDTWESRPITWTAPLGGASLDLNIDYADGSQEVRRFTLPPVPSVISANIRPPVFNSDGTVTVEWTNIAGSLPGGAGFADLEVEIIDNSGGEWREIVELWDIDPSLSSVTVPATILESGKIYMISVGYVDLYGREFLTERYFEMQ